MIRTTNYKKAILLILASLYTVSCISQTLNPGFVQVSLAETQSDSEKSKNNLIQEAKSFLKRQETVVELLKNSVETNKEESS